MVFGPSVMCLMALLVLAQSAAVEKQPPFQSSNHGGGHAPIKVAKRQELVEQPENLVENTEKLVEHTEELAAGEEIKVDESSPKDSVTTNSLTKDSLTTDAPTEGAPAGVAFDGGVQNGGKHNYNNCASVNLPASLTLKICGCQDPLCPKCDCYE